MNFADYIYNMTEEDFKEAQIIVDIAGTLRSSPELDWRIQRLRKIFRVEEER